MKNVTFGIEALENRRMMAGDVAVNVTGGGDLVINGDNAGNEVVIRALPGQDAFYVQGLNGTTVNGSGFAIVEDVTDDIRINLRDGDNTIALTGYSGSGDVSNPFILNDDVDIRTGDGNDIVLVNADLIGGDLRVRTSDGDDSVVVAQSTIAGQLNVNTGDDSDLLGVVESTIEGRSNANMGNDADVFYTMLSTWNDRARVNMGSGDDIAAVLATEFNARFDFNGGSGVDSMWEGEAEYEDARYRNEEEFVEVVNFGQVVELEQIVADTVDTYQAAEDASIDLLNL